MRDKIIKQVIKKIKSRSDVGFKKYGVTLNDDDQPLDTWLNHIQEELMDAVNYIEKARSVLRDEIEECYIRDSQSISRYPESNYWTQDTT
tara:strand:+ start:1116 stop:1385 length:270 start_codon:yes stop_codon:yes gene_type:complete